MKATTTELITGVWVMKVILHNVNGVPEAAHDDGTVSCWRLIRAKRAYVNRINFPHTKTEDDVLRRVRQMESGWASTYLVGGQE
jgi:outer membrane protein assembly factor BamA